MKGQLPSFDLYHRLYCCYVGSVTMTWVFDGTLKFRVLTVRPAKPTQKKGN
jgi:hypothetical protein